MSKKLIRAEVPTYLAENWGLRCSRASLARLAVVGGGPAFHRSGRNAYYDRTGLDQWAQEKLGDPAETATAHRVMKMMAGSAA